MNLSIVIPVLNASQSLPRALLALAGVEAEILVVDGGSTDGGVGIAREHGARVIVAPKGRGQQLRVGAEASNRDWLLFLHADTILEEGWREIVSRFCCVPENRWKAAAFRFALDDSSLHARRLEKMVAWRIRMLGLPYGDQGLLIHRDLYRAVGGFRSMALMEDVDIVRRIGRRRVVTLAVAARTSAARWRREGWLRRSARNLFCLTLYFAGVPTRFIKRLYG